VRQKAPHWIRWPPLKLRKSIKKALTWSEGTHLVGGNESPNWISRPAPHQKSRIHKRAFTWSEGTHLVGGKESPNWISQPALHQTRRIHKRAFTWSEGTHLVGGKESLNWISRPALDQKRHIHTKAFTDQKAPTWSEEKRGKWMRLAGKVLVELCHAKLSSMMPACSEIRGELLDTYCFLCVRCCVCCVCVYF